MMGTFVDLYCDLSVVSPPTVQSYLNVATFIPIGAPARSNEKKLEYVALFASVESTFLVVEECLASGTKNRLRS